MGLFIVEWFLVGSLWLIVTVYDWVVEEEWCIVRYLTVVCGGVVSDGSVFGGWCLVGWCL
jgi:hypothetical protein